MRRCCGVEVSRGWAYMGLLGAVRSAASSPPSNPAAEPPIPLSAPGRHDAMVPAAGGGAAVVGAHFLNVLADPSAFSKNLSQRVINNPSLRDKPWESSCVEVSQTQLRFYFETSTTAGLRGYQQIAVRVSAGELPGEAINMMGVGYATWVVAREDYIELLARSQAIDSGTGPGRDNTPP